MADMTDNPDPCTDTMSAGSVTSDSVRLSPTQQDSPPANTYENSDYVPPYDSTQNKESENQQCDDGAQYQTTEEQQYGSPQYQSSGEQQYDSPQYQGTDEQIDTTQNEGMLEQQEDNSGENMASVTNDQYTMMSPEQASGKGSSGQPSPRVETADEPMGDVGIEGGVRTPTGSTGSGGYAQQMMSPCASTGAQEDWTGEKSSVGAENSPSPTSPMLEGKIASPDQRQGTSEVSTSDTMMSGGGAGAEDVEDGDDADIDTGYTDAGYGDDNSIASGGMDNVNVMGDTDVGGELLRDPICTEIGLQMTINVGKVLEDVNEDADEITEEVTNVTGISVVTTQVTETITAMPQDNTSEQTDETSYDDEDVDTIEQEKAYASFTQVTVETTYEGLTGVSSETATEAMMESIAGEMLEKERSEMIPEKEYESLSSGITEYTVRILPGGIVEKAADFKSSGMMSDYDICQGQRNGKLMMEAEMRKQNLCAHLINLEGQTMKNPNTQIRILTLHKGENLETTLFRLEKGWILRFALGPSLHADNVRLFTNHPKSRNEKFQRQVFRELQWQNACNMKNDRHDNYIDVHMVIPGSFNYYFTIDESGDFDKANGKGYFLIDPTLPVGENEEIKMNCIQCQTVIAKSLGPFEEWKDRLLVAKESGYNMIHFTPLQKLGISNSSYSITDHKALNPIFSKNQPVTYDDVEKFTRWMNKEWKMLTANDLVFNHTSKCSDWLLQHPECGYNLANSPHLKPSFIVDRIFHHFSLQISRDEWKHYGVTAIIDREDHLGALKHLLHTKAFPEYRVHEFYLCDIEECIRRFRRRVKGNATAVRNKDVYIIPDENFGRMKGTIDFDVAIGYLKVNKTDVENSDEKLEEYCHKLRQLLQKLNDQMCSEIGRNIDVAIDNYIANVHYRFLAGDGPRLNRVTADEPLMHDYFSMPANLESSVYEEEKLMYTNDAKYIMACNGWVMSDNPLGNFAEYGSFIYFRRELIGWGDSIKLRYGNCPEDCPYLWQHMKEYTECSAKIADAIRLDNCHSTPLHVAEYMIDAARAIRPDLYVFAELFTSNEATDNLFMNHLGINSLIRESLAAWNAHELGRLVHRFGGQPVGAFVQPHVQPLIPTMAHAIFFDQTHDNESPIAKRSVYDTLPSTALVSMSCCASGSNRGYDELVPHHIHVVNEKRIYPSWNPNGSGPNECSLTSGIIHGKKMLNDLHYELGKLGFEQVYVDQIDSDVVSVTRHNPGTHHSIVLIARTAFSFPNDPNNDGSYIKPIHFQGVVDEVLFEMRMIHKGGSEYKHHQEFINGLPDYHMDLTQKIKIDQSKMIYISNVNDSGTEIKFKNFPPSSVIALRITLCTPAKDAILQMRTHLNQFGYLMRSYSGRSLFEKGSKSSNFRAIVGEMNFSGLNRAMFRVSSEDESDGLGIGNYDIPDFGCLTYCGLQGICDLLNRIRASNDLGHPICNNLRQGDWFPDFIVKRLNAHANTKDLGEWFERVFENFQKIPRYLVPCYFDAIISGAFMILRENCIDMMSSFVVDGSSFVQALALGSVQFCGFVKHAELPPLADDIHEPRPKTLYTDEKGRKHLDVLSLAAGLPHFASGFARNWGRDTFIAIRGDLLLTGRFSDARYLILAYGGCLRHGLIPNLLLEGEGARFNCRDAFWWWIQCIQDYVNLAPEGQKILDDNVARIYPDDECTAKITNPTIMPLNKVMQEGMEKHAKGVAFRERNAGPQIDNHMTDQGFNVSFGVDWKTGFVYGGNRHNCGTWMDMMGSSVNAGTRGVPSTPRDGSAVEIVGLCKSTVTWLDKLYQQKLYPYEGVEIKEDKIITYKNWAEKIQNNFEKHFWIPKEESTNDPNHKLINRRGIYKDSFNASDTWRDYQLRPNFPMAMVVAPELFSPENAWHALIIAGSVLQGPLGMKTLDPTDWNYCGFYDNNNDSNDPKVSKGFNYHQGPEWVWPIGFFFRAKLHFAKVIDKSKPGTFETTVKEIKASLTRHYQHLVNSNWKSLPELTNENGAYCHPSCQAQAWSVSTILETLYDMEHIV